MSKTRQELLESIVTKIFSLNRLPYQSDWYIREGMKGSKDGFSLPLQSKFTMNQEECDLVIEIINQQLPEDMKEFLKLDWLKGDRGVEFMFNFHNLVALPKEYSPPLEYSPEALNDL